MIWPNTLLLCLVFIWASGDPEPNVNVKINVNVNGESEEARESGISCNLVWNQEEHRPLIMIRKNKEIVPPILNTRISDNPNRVPLGLKLVFACPGHSNKFIQIEGNHTKLHGECVEPDRFKVCVNNNPEILELNELSCSRQMFPSFIKQDNATSDKKSCDGQGGELYKQGYTYGDYHEFKDLEIDVCFRESSQSSICTTPNLNGNETDYRTSQRFKELRGRDTRMVCGIGAPAPAQTETWKQENCVANSHGGPVEAKCKKKHLNVARDHNWCYTGNNNQEDWDYCTGLCNARERRNLGTFTTRHICKQITAGNQGKPCRTTIQQKPSTRDALDFIRDLAPNVHSSLYHLFNKNPGNSFQIARVLMDNPLNPGDKEDVCLILNPGQSWTCTWDNNNPRWASCTNRGNCIGGFAVVNGHFASDSYFC